MQEPLAETISGAEYSSAAPDELKDDAACIVRMYNTDRVADVMRIAAQQMDVAFEEVRSASAQGCPLRATLRARCVPQGPCATPTRAQTRPASGRSLASACVHWRRA